MHAFGRLTATLKKTVRMSRVTELSFCLFIVMNVGLTLCLCYVSSSQCVCLPARRYASAGLCDSNVCMSKRRNDFFTI